MQIHIWIFICTLVLVAGIIRGYSGFGFSIIAVTGLSMALPPAEIVPVILLLEIAASTWLLPRVWHDIHWRSLSWLSVGVLIGTPGGVYLLSSIPPEPMRVAISLAVLGLALMLRLGISLKKMPGRGQTVATGMASGLLNGSATIGGPPVILFYFSTPAGAAVSRASLIAFFFGTDLLALALCGTQGLVDGQTAVMGAVCLVPLLIGITLGNRFYSQSRAEAFRRKVLILLMALAVASLVRALWG